MAGKYGAKWIFGLGTLSTAILSLLTPIAAEKSFRLLVALRILEGLGEGVTWPAMHALFSKWATPLERSKFPTLTYSGSYVGTVVAFISSGYLCSSSFLGGWPSVFYVFGSFGCIWFCFWCVFTASAPRSHRWISLAEKEYLETEIAKNANPNVGKIPLRHILLSMPVWAIIVSHVSFNWGFYTLLTELPAFFTNILGFDIKKNGLISSLPYIVQTVVQVSSGQLIDRLRANKISTTVTRKFTDCVGHLIPAVCLLTVGFVGCNSSSGGTVVPGSGPWRSLWSWLLRQSFGYCARAFRFAVWYFKHFCHYPGIFGTLCRWYYYKQ